jgi:hypothetical protein
MPLAIGHVTQLRLILHGERRLRLCLCSAPPPRQVQASPHKTSSVGQLLQGCPCLMIT